MSDHPRHPASRPNKDIILIVLDTHRADRLGFYGYERETSPNLDAFARSATVYDYAIAPAQWTIPSHASIFTGLPPATHLVTQANSVLDGKFTTAAEILSAAGYDTVAYCNNPLLGLIHNDIAKGFQTFYNYSGTAPFIPHDFPDGSLFPMVRMWERIAGAFRRIVDPIQNKFATSNRLLQIATHPIFVPLWTRLVHFKGNTSRSIHQASRFLASKSNEARRPPYFLFLNLMETHLPFLPPQEYVRRFAPYLSEDMEAKSFMRSFNNQAMHWLIPLKEPFTVPEAKIINDMYDAEVAYQDHLLAEIFDPLDKPAVRDNTLVIITADHGEMLGEHQFMGHSFGVYKELIQVPLIIRAPGQKKNLRVVHPVSTTRLFHTMLAAADVPVVKQADHIQIRPQEYCLLNEIDGRYQSTHPVVSEAYAPQDAIKMMERVETHLIEKFHTRETHRSLYSQSYKLYAIEGVEDRITHLDDRPPHRDAFFQANDVHILHDLRTQLEDFVTKNSLDESENWTPPTTDLSDPMIEKRLRDLGYLA